MQIEDLIGNYSMIGELYNLREEEIGKNIKELKNKLNNVSEGKIQELIEKSVENVDNKEEILKKLGLLIENYEIKIASYMEEGYKQGFKDAFKLVMECIEK